MALSQNHSRTAQSELLWRFVLGSATLGLLIGVYEAALLFFTPWIPTLLESDVSYQIWFLAPLLDLLGFALVGLPLGWLASRGLRPLPQRSAVLAALIFGMAGAHVGWSLHLVHVWVGDPQAPTQVRVPALWFAATFAIALLFVRLGWQETLRIFDPATRWPLTPLAWALAVAMTITIGGLAVARLHLLEIMPSEQAGSPSTPPRPNIVLISLDTVRADHLSVYGYHRPTTPNLERLARLGTVFENAIAPSSWTLPSHSSMLTGLLPHQHGANTYHPLDSEPRTLAEVLTASGYETATFNANGYGLASWGMPQGFEYSDDNSTALRHNLSYMLVGRVFVQTFYHRLVAPDFYFRRNAAEINRGVLRWFRRRSNRPFFLFINYFDAHDPYFAPPPFRTKFGTVSNAAMQRASFAPSFPLDPPLSAEEQASLIDGYDNCLSYLDNEVGNLVDFLSRSPVGSNTVIIITSDHGEAFNEHQSYLHGRSLHREVLRVPLIFLGPGIPQGQRWRDPVRIRDLFATILDLALRESPLFHSSSLRRHWLPAFQTGPWDGWAISELVPFLPGFRPVMLSLMTSEWHYIHDSTGQVELYRWPVDPQETTNLAGHPEYQQLLIELHHRLEMLLGSSVRPWRGVEYLYALDRPGHSFLRETAFGASLPLQDLGTRPRVGSVQALFAPDPRSSQRLITEPDEQLIKSLPYR